MSKRTGAELIAAERERQVSKEGWTPDHDDTHNEAELSKAAIAYASTGNGSYRLSLWPWRDDPKKIPSVTEAERNGFKPDNLAGTNADDPGRVSDLVKAGALIAAEIDRLQRKLLDSDGQGDVRGERITLYRSGVDGYGTSRWEEVGDPDKQKPWRAGGMYGETREALLLPAPCTCSYENREGIADERISDDPDCPVHGEPEEARTDRVILEGTGPLCARCMQHESNHVPGPPSPPLTKGHLGATKDRPSICNDFKSDAPPEQEDTYA